jgi:hypothetical protein
VFDESFKLKKLTKKEIVSFHYFFYLSKNEEKLKVTAEEICDNFNPVRLTSFPYLINSLDFGRKFEDLVDLRMFISNKLLSSEEIAENFLTRISILSSLLRIPKKFEISAILNLFKFADLVDFILPDFRLSFQILPILKQLKELDKVNLGNYFQKIFEKNTKLTYPTFLNLMYLYTSLELPVDENLTNMIQKDLTNYEINTSSKSTFFSVEQKIIYNSTLHLLLTKFGIHADLLEINEPEKNIKQVKLLYDILRQEMKKVKFALFTEKAYVLEKYFYFDCFVPTMNLGFLIHSDKNLFESQQYECKITDNYDTYREVVLSLFDIKVVVIEENLLLNQIEELNLLLRKHLIDK